VFFLAAGGAASFLVARVRLASQQGARALLDLRQENRELREQMMELAARDRELARLKQVEATLKKNIDLLNQMGSMAHVGGWELDMATMHQTWTDEVYCIHEIDHSFVPGLENAIQFYAPSSRPVVQKLVADAIENGTPFDAELEFITARGNRRWIRTIGKAYREKGVTRTIGGTFQDITEKKHKEDEVNQLNAELEERVAQRTAQLENANHELEAFSYSVSHDLRAPLRAINGYANVLLEDYVTVMDAEAQRLFQGILAATVKMERLITDLLALSRTTRSEINLSGIDMAGLVNDTYLEISTPESRERYTFEVHSMPNVQGDIVLIRQVWANLLSNAIKYTRPQDAPSIEAGGFVEGQRNVYYVKDNGVGFDPAYVHKLFGAFQRLHRPDEFEGTGVGLAIVQRIIHRHGGVTWAEGQVGQGATFYFTLRT